LNGGLVGRVAHPGIVAVHDQDFVGRFIAQAFSERPLFSGVGGGGREVGDYHETKARPEAFGQKWHAPPYFGHRQLATGSCW
jgi:hypothetical protein